MIQKIGSMVYQLRKKLYVSQESLGRGLLSVPELSRIENGEKEGDSFMMSTLFQRLGKSMDQFEMSVSNEEYKLVLLRAFIQESMESGDYDRTEELLDEYEDSPESEKLLHVQYAKMVRAVLGYVLTKDAQNCLNKLKEAIGMTFEDEGRLDWTGYCFSIQEVLLFLLIAHMEMEVGAVRDAILLLSKLHDCIDVNYTAEAARVQVYPKCCFLLAKAYLQDGDKEKAGEVCNKGIECLIQKCSLIFVDELLELQQVCEENEKNRKVIDALQWTYDLVGHVRTKEFVLSLMYDGVCQEITLSNELLREMRLAQGRTQEELSEGICSRETLARIEKGRTPSRKNLQDLLRKLGIEREKYYSYVLADDWEAYELIVEYKKKCVMGEHEDALDIIRKIEKMIDMSVPANRQFVETAYVRYQIRRREISWNDAIDRLTELLRYTMPEYDGQLIRVPSREEILILNRIALCLKLSGRREEAIVLYEEFLDKYQASKVEPEHHVIAMKMLYLNYAELLEVCDYLEKSEAYSKEGLRLMLKCKQGETIGVYLANLACVYEKQRTQAEKATLILPCLDSSYELLEFYRFHKRSSVVKRHLEQLI